MTLSLFDYSLIAFIGIFVGIINIMAGGGSNIILPLLMLFGLDPQSANATNRVGIFVQSVVGARGFQKKGLLDLGDFPMLMVPTLIGGVCGALLAAYLGEIINLIPFLNGVSTHQVEKVVLLGTMLIVAAVVLFKPSTVLADSGEAFTMRQAPRAFFWLWLAGVYGGFVQAGVGFVLTTALAGILRYDLVRANALKLMCTLAFTTVALLIFIYRGQVVWLVGIMLAIGNSIGAMLGVKFAIKVGKKTLRWILFAMTVVAVVAAIFAK